MRLILSLVTSLVLGPVAATADVARVLDDHILPATQGFAEATQALSDAAATDCTAPALRPAYQAAFDAWMGLSHLGFGPLEQDGRALTIEFWPDPRGLVGRATSGLIADADPVVKDAKGFAQVSIAARGLMAMEQVIYGNAAPGYAAGDYACRYVTALAGDLARMGGMIRTDWHDHAALMRNAGQPDNARYLTPAEPAQALYTALLSTLEFDADQRLGRPMGTFDKPRPKLAEAWRSDRAQRNLGLSLQALHGLAVTLSDQPMPMTETAFQTAMATAKVLGDPRLSGVDTPQGRLRAEILQQQISAVRMAAKAEIGGSLGLTAGFNSKDGD